VAQLGVAALDKEWAIASEPYLDLSHACSPECINTYGLVSNYSPPVQKQSKQALAAAIKLYLDILLVS
jgi:hypothetical protein